MKKLLKQLYSWRKDLIEFIKCINPVYGYRKSKEAEKNYMEARTDVLTGYPNGIALREYLKSIKNSSLAVYAVDLLGLHNINELYGYKTGDLAIISMLKIVENVVSPFGGMVFREYFRGDEAIAVITNIDEKTASNIPCIIKNRCNSYTIEGIPDILNVAVGYAFSTNDGSPFNCLDRCKEESSVDKAKFYEKNPQLERRKYRNISR